MNILKPQNLHIQELENKYLVHIKEDEKLIIAILKMKNVII